MQEKFCPHCGRPNQPTVTRISTPFFPFPVGTVGTPAPGTLTTTTGTTIGGPETPVSPIPTWVHDVKERLGDIEARLDELEDLEEE